MGAIKSYAKLIHVAIMFILMVVIGQLPAFGSVTDVGMRVLGVFIGTIYGWLFIDLLWPSLISMVALGLTGFMTIPEAFSSALSSSIVSQVIIICLFAGALSKVGAVDMISNWLMTRKSLSQKPWLLIISIFAATIIGVMLGLGMAILFMFWALFVNVAKKCGYDLKDPLVTFLISALVMVFFTASGIMPYRGIALMFLGFLEPLGVSIAYGPFVAFSLLYTILLTVVLLLAGKFIFKVDASRFKLPEDEIERIKHVKINSQQKLSIVVMVAYFICMFFPAFMPADWTVTIILNKLGLLGITSIALMVLALAKGENGKRLVSLADCHSAVPWDAVWLVAATMPLSAAMESEDSGIMSTIVTMASPILASMSSTLFIIVAMIVLGLLTQVTHNLVLGAMFIPFLTEIYMSMGGSPELLYMCIFLALNCAYVTPAASTNSALMHGHELVSPKDAYAWGTIALVATWVILIAMIPLGNLLW